MGAEKRPCGTVEVVGRLGQMHPSFGPGQQLDRVVRFRSTAQERHRREVSNDRRFQCELREQYRSANDARDRLGSVEAREGEGAGTASLLPIARGAVTQGATSN
jgi:hypothetical protein